jgi:hypothetical protein
MQRGPFSLRALHQIADALDARLILVFSGAEPSSIGCLTLTMLRSSSSSERFSGVTAGTSAWRSASIITATGVAMTSSPSTAWARLALVIEVKTALGDLQDTIGRLDVKVRVAATVVRSLGWRPTAFVPVLILAEDTTARRTVRDHPTLPARFTERGRSGLSWIQSPDGQAVPTGVLLFRKLSNARQAGVIRVKRVSRRRALTSLSPGDSAPIVSRERRPPWHLA